MANARLLCFADEGHQRSVNIPPTGGFLGRGEDCLVRTGNPLVRRHHARLFAHGLDWFVADLAGATYVNDRLLRAEERPLAHGDLIRCRSFQVRFVCDGPGRAEDGEAGTLFTNHGLRRGQRIGKYQVVRPLGVGGMGSVYEVLHDELGRRALKLLHPAYSRDPQLVQRFRNEAIISTYLRHASIVQIFDVDEMEGGRPFLVMEYLSGETLAERLRRAPQQSVRFALLVGAAIASALTVVHRRGIIHRDLKPANVFLCRTDGSKGEHIKVLDFGIARVAAPLNASPIGRRTQCGAILGTPEYMAPELCRGAMEAREPCDVYALGIMLYEILAQGPPFTHARAEAMLLDHLERAPPPISALRPDLPDEPARLLMRMLSKEEAARPTMAEVERVLVEALSTARAW